MLLDALKQALEKAFGPDWSAKRLIIAVSGGVDSMVLGELLSRLLPAESLVVAHFNHQLRGEASDLDEQLVVDFFQKKGLIVERTRANREGEGFDPSENGMRGLRRRFFEEIRSRHRFDYIATAHHSNDQLETLLMRLVRGTGIEGLSSMVPVRGKFLKPLLSFSKNDILEFARESAIPFRDDSTNSETLYFRNQIRHELVPQFLRLGRNFGGEEALLCRISALTEELSRHASFVDDLAAEWAKTHVTTSRFWTRVPLVEWLKLASPLSENVFRSVVRELGGEVPSRDALERLVLALRSNKRGSELEGKIRVRQSCGFVFFQNDEQRTLLMSERRFEKTQHGFVCEDLGLSFRVEAEEYEGAEMRFFAPGDFYRRTKLKKLLLTRRIPSPERSLLPVLARPGTHELLWYFPQGCEEVRAERLEFPFSVKS